MQQFPATFHEEALNATAVEVRKNLRKAFFSIDDGWGAAVEEMVCLGQDAVAVNGDAQRIVARPKACGERGIVKESCPCSDHYGFAPGSQSVHEGLGECGGKKDGSLIGLSADVAILTLSPFQGNPGTVLLMEGEEASVQLTAFLFQYPYDDLATGIAEFLYAQSVHQGKRVGASYDDAWYTAANDEVGTGRGLALMGTRFQADVDGATAEEFFVLYARDGINFSMRTTELTVKPFSYNLPITDYHGSHHRVGWGSCFSQASQLQAALHVFQLKIQDVVISLYLCSMNALQMLQEKYAVREARALYELVLKQRFGLSRTDILLGKDTKLSADDKAELQIIVERLLKGEPVQYVLGSEDFCGHTFLVGPGVLIPRPETQQLVRLVCQNVAPGSTVLDVGTGSGCIAISLALEGYDVTALDVSDEALAYARRNACRLGAEVRFVKQDILTSRSTSTTPLFDSSSACERGVCAIVSNPPYVCRSEAEQMEDNVLNHEPHIALFVPDDNPLIFYRTIADLGLDLLKAGGLLFFETNRAYAEQTAEMLRQKDYEEVKVVKDEFENDRFVWARKV